MPAISSTQFGDKPMLHRLYLIFLLLGAAILAGAGCTKSGPQQGVEPQSDADPEPGAGPESGVDYHSYANAGDYRVLHLDLDLTFDFSRKVLEGEGASAMGTLDLGQAPGGHSYYEVKFRGPDDQVIDITAAGWVGT